MKEKDRSEIMVIIESDADLENPEEYRQVAEIRIRLDNNRQLTRIADQGELSFNLAKHDRKLIIDMLADEIAPDVPADALVVAVKKLLTNTDRWVCDQYVKTLANELTTALADHEKAVR